MVANDGRIIDGPADWGLTGRKKPPEGDSLGSLKAGCLLAFVATVVLTTWLLNWLADIAAKHR